MDTADDDPLTAMRMLAECGGITDGICIDIGDAQKMPFPDDYADVIVSRGTLTFIDDIAQCLRQVDRVLKPTGGTITRKQVCV